MKTETKTRRKKGKVVVARTQRSSTSIYGHSLGAVRLGIVATDQRWPLEGQLQKVSSAYCSRSNSAREYKFRKWPSSPSRGGIHVGRSSPIWQVQRGGSDTRSSEPLAWNADKGVKKEGLESQRSKNVGGGGARAKVLNLNVPMRIGYHSHLSCRNGASSANGNSCSHEQGCSVASSRYGTFCSLRDGDDDNLRASSMF
uniref:Uncharacterized protein n=1 Tax=Nelumbo nucifera TaxID=4432 RepID=A0A822XSB4_NELNU|nr:TPA_asm: hypothetical protein HUJ06_024355 [Nelumbo nucifera]